jgi:hypothetical protein
MCTYLIQKVSRRNRHRGAGNGTSSRQSVPGRRKGLETIWTGMIKRRLGIPNTTPLVAWARGDYPGLLVPGGVLKHWGPICVAVTPGELWVCFGNDKRRYPVPAMVLASVASNPQGALRVDFMEGDPLVVLVDDGGTIREQLRREIWDYDVGLRNGAQPFPALPETSPVLLAEAELEWNTADKLLAAGGEELSVHFRTERSMQRARELEHQARVDGLRAVRSTFLSYQVDSADSEGAT